MNTFGRNFRCTTFGESHGKAIGVVIDGCPPGLPLSEADIQPLLDRRRPGRSPFASARQEADRVEILSGVFEGRTTGAPIALLIQNRDVRSEDYEPLRTVFRPGHADYAYQAKYGIRDHRGGGRSSGRETAARVAAAAVAMKILAARGIRIAARIREIHGRTDPKEMEQEIAAAQAAGDSVGGIVEVTASGVPPALGDPVFGKLDALIAAAMMGIGAVKGVEIGEGFRAARLFGSENNDPITPQGFASNHAGGILGGISTGQEIVVRIAVKPTSSIAKPQKTVDTENRAVEITVQGRHDPCIVPRILPVAESMLALVILDCLLEQAKYRGPDAGDPR
ncbi:MAG: chorismate synthase [Methanomicrobiales archaeon]|nr:chorismate synthase [Methanomicrobiales archaeon]MDI6875804.1 chorismate synthase [Methanomicrobiales archaeon]